MPESDARRVDRTKKRHFAVRAQELCEGRGGRPGLPSLISVMVSLDVKQHTCLKMGSDESHFASWKLVVS